MALDLREDNRLFIAFDLPRDLRSVLVRAGEGVAREHGGSAVPAGNLHATVAFLGQIAPERGSKVVHALDAARGPALPVRVSGLVACPSSRRARLVAAELTGRERDLVERWGALAAATCRAAGMPAPGPAWPHVTVARFRKPPRLPSAWAPGAAPDDVRMGWYPSSERTFVVRRVTLYDSHLSRRGPPRYEPLATVTLTAMEPEGATEAPGAGST